MEKGRKSGGMRLLWMLLIVLTSRLSSAATSTAIIGTSVNLVCSQAASSGPLGWTLTQATTQTIITSYVASSYVCAGPFLSQQQKCRDGISFDQRNTTQITIRSIQFTDAGRYNCSFRLTGGSQDSQEDSLVTVIESASPRLTITTSDSASKLNSSSTPTQVQPGTTLNISCSLSFSGFIKVPLDLLLYRPVSRESKYLVQGTPPVSSQFYDSSSTVVISSQYRVAENDGTFTFQCLLTGYSLDTVTAMSFQVTENPNDDEKKHNIMVTAVVTSVVLGSAVIVVIVIIVCCVMRKKQGMYYINRGSTTTANAATTPWQTGRGVSTVNSPTRDANAASHNNNNNRPGVRSFQQYNNPALSLDE